MASHSLVALRLGGVGWSLSQVPPAEFFEAFLGFVVWWMVLSSFALSVAGLWWFASQEAGGCLHFGGKVGSSSTAGAGGAGGEKAAPARVAKAKHADGPAKKRKGKRKVA